jgi:hypothetical protein
MPFILNAAKVISGMLMLLGYVNQILVRGDDHPGVAKFSSTNIFLFFTFFFIFIFYFLFFIFYFLFFIFI